MEPWGYPNNCYSHLMTCVLARYHLEAESGESGLALALLSITHSTVSTSQPSILDSGDNYYFYRAGGGGGFFGDFHFSKTEGTQQTEIFQILSLNNSSLHQYVATTLITIITHDIRDEQVVIVLLRRQIIDA